MCGICGIVYHDQNRAIEQDMMVRMKDIITHRGPDDDGLYIKGNVGLGFRRLSIVDLSSGHQPMCNEDGTVWVIFNGEIYNHADLRKELVACGHIYKTRSDTESIIHLYEEYGVDGFQKMNGMFGIALWDARKHRLVLVRDRLGIKPLYYHHTPECFIFGSEIKAILESKKYKPEFNDAGLREFLIFRYIAGENTPFKGILNLLPGHILILENGKISTKKFWDLPSPKASTATSETVAIEQLDELLEDSVRLRLMSDVPLGTFNSGGLDSSLVSAYAAKLSNLQLNTFSVGFHEPDFDESAYAMTVSKRYQTNHHVITVDNRLFADSLADLIWFNDEPLNHANSVQIYHISKLAKEFVTVVLTGEGSDEIFGGYPRYLIARMHTVFGHAPLPIRVLAGDILALLRMRRVKKVGQAMSLSPVESVVMNSALIEPALVDQVLVDKSRADFIDSRLSLIGNPSISKDNLVDCLTRLDLKTYLVSILNRQDKMSMAASIESRVPFLDYRIVEWGLKIPQSLKFGNYQTKAIVKKLGERMLPKEIVYRKKSGFGVPVGKWLRDSSGLGRYLELFSEPRFRQRGYFNVGQIDRLVNEHRSGKKDNGELLWELINLELWQRIFIEGGI